MIDPLPPELDAATRARILGGAIIVDLIPVAEVKVPRIVVQAIIDAPVAKVWAVIEDGTQYYRFMPRLKSSEVLAHDGENVRTRVVVELPFPMKNLSCTTMARHWSIEGQAYVRQWEMERGDYKSNRGRWVLRPLEGEPSRTYAFYEIHVIPKIPIPRKLQAGLQEKAMPGMIKAVRDEVKRRG